MPSIRDRLSAVLLSAVLLTMGCGVRDGDQNSDASRISVPADTSGASSICKEGESIKYSGQNERTVLDLLLEIDSNARVVGSGANAYVVTICGREASNSDHEYWALYVNGEYAQTGAGSLMTKNGDEITWKIETY